MIRTARTIAVALHDVEPATFERCALIRDWLDDHGIDRVTLLVIPARDLHPLASRSPEMLVWLDERRRSGDTIAQHGFQHLQSRRGPWGRRPAGAVAAARAAEFVGLDAGETRRAVDAGRRVLKLAGIDARGFVAPAYAYTPALTELMPSRFGWWASRMRVYGRGRQRAAEMAPAWSVRSAGGFSSTLSPVGVRLGAVTAGRTLRIDVHPGDLNHPHHMSALEWVLSRAGGQRAPVTYDELIA